MISNRSKNRSIEKAGPKETPFIPGLSSRQVDRAASLAVDRLPSAFESLRQSPDSPRSLEDPQAKLAAMPPAETVKWSRDFLKTGKHKSTGLTFEIASDHSMKQWPTLRTFLLDVLRGIDPAAHDRAALEIITSWSEDPPSRR